MVLIDDDDPRHPELQPTRENIVRRERWTRPHISLNLSFNQAQANQTFSGRRTREWSVLLSLWVGFIIPATFVLLLFPPVSGHATQEETDDIEEEDRMDEC